MKRTLILSITTAIVFQVAVLALANGNFDSRATDVLMKAREALGGDAKLKAVKSLAINAKYRRLLGDRELAGDFDLELLLPDKIRRSETMNPVPSVEITRIDVLNGNLIWSDSQRGAGGHGGNIVIRGPEGPDQQAAANTAIRAELIRLCFTFLLAIPPTMPLDLTWVGEAEAPDGKANVIDVMSPNNFTARLFLDQKTNRPLMLTYKGRPQRVTMRSMQAAAAPSHEEMEKRAKEEAARVTAVPEVEFQVSLDDYRSVDGVLFPHSISRQIDGKPNEEIEVKKIALNPQIKPDRFEKK